MVLLLAALLWVPAPAARAAAGAGSHAPPREMRLPIPEKPTSKGDSPSLRPEIPLAPYYYVLDEPKAIPPKALRALQTLLIEHDRLTGEQLMIAVVDGARGESLPAYAQRLFEKWRVGMRGRANGALLVLDWRSRKAAVRTGAAFDAVLSESRAEQILDDYLIPEAKSGDAARGLSMAAVEILRALDSPLVQSGKARQIVRAGGFTGPWHPLPRGSSVPLWIALILVGLVPAGAAVYLITSAEAHFTSTGWYRPRPADQLRSSARNLLRRARGEKAKSTGGLHGAGARW